MLHHSCLCEARPTGSCCMQGALLYTAADGCLSKTVTYLTIHGFEPPTKIQQATTRCRWEQSPRHRYTDFKTCQKSNGLRDLQDKAGTCSFIQKNQSIQIVHTAPGYLSTSSSEANYSNTTPLSASNSFCSLCCANSHGEELHQSNNCHNPVYNRCPYQI